MTPTNELRWIERIVQAPGRGAEIGIMVLVLQQKWVMSLGAFGEWYVTNSEEWRDVPTIKE